MQELFSAVNQINIIAEMLEIRGNVGSNENRPVLIFRRIITQQIENLVPRLYVKACGRLVENQKLCFV